MHLCTALWSIFYGFENALYIFAAFKSLYFSLNKMHFAIYCENINLVSLCDLWPVAHLNVHSVVKKGEKLLPQTSRRYTFYIHWIKSWDDAGTASNSDDFQARCSRSSASPPPRSASEQRAPREDRVVGRACRAKAIHSSSLALWPASFASVELSDWTKSWSRTWERLSPVNQRETGNVHPIFA